MNKKIFLKIFLFLAFGLFTSMSFTSCGDDKDEPGNDNSTEQTNPTKPGDPINPTNPDVYIAGYEGDYGAEKAIE
jgi:uncharacterized alpha/beta hydrolase family protein